MGIYADECAASRLKSDAGRHMHRGKMNSLRFYLPHESTGKISTHKAALTAFGAGVRGCVCGFAAAVADAEVCARAAVNGVDRILFMRREQRPSGL